MSTDDAIPARSLTTAEVAQLGAEGIEVRREMERRLYAAGNEVGGWDERQPAAPPPQDTGSLSDETALREASDFVESEGITALMAGERARHDRCLASRGAPSGEAVDINALIDEVTIGFGRTFDTANVSLPKLRAVLARLIGGGR